MRPACLALIVASFVGDACAQSAPAVAPKLPVITSGTSAAGVYLAPGVEPDLAYGAYQRGYYLTALGEAKKRIDADKDAASAMALIGELYKEGLGVKLDDREAARWFKLAAEHGDLEGSFRLAIAYLAGKGVSESVVNAKPLLEAAAAKGHPAALYQLGLLAMTGDIQDPVKSADYFRRAAEAGDDDAIYALGLMYKEGRGVEKGLAKAAELLKRAADSNLSAAQVDYAIMLFNGEGVAADEAGAAKYFARAAAANNPVAMNRLARLYAFGRGVKTDQVEAMKWHILARAAGLNDENLDAILNKLSPRDRSLVEEAVRKQVGR